MPIAGTPSSLHSSASSSGSRPPPPSAAEPDWPRLLLSTIAYAHARLRRSYWRGSLSGICPDGYDASSVAAQAVLQFILHSQGRYVRDPYVIRWRLRRYVLREVNRLRHLKENRVLRNEPDLALVPQPDIDPVSPTVLIPDPSPTPDDALLQTEAETQATHLAEQFAQALSPEPALQALWHLRLAGSPRPRHLAAALRLPVRTVENLEKRLQRRWRLFQKARCAKKV